MLFGFAAIIRALISLIKGTIFRENKFGKISGQRLVSIRWHFVWGKGTRFKEIVGGPILKIEIFNAFLFIF